MWTHCEGFFMAWCLVWRKRCPPCMRMTSSKHGPRLPSFIDNGVVPLPLVLLYCTCSQVSYIPLSLLHLGFFLMEKCPKMRFKSSLPYFISRVTVGMHLQMEVYIRPGRDAGSKDRHISGTDITDGVGEQI
jgi:hypothetical protein